jgi:hypothetical protein
VAPFAFDPSTINQQPGFKFQLDEGLKLLDRSAAAKGKSFTPDARQAAQQWGQGLASRVGL